MRPGTLQALAFVTLAAATGAAARGLAVAREGPFDIVFVPTAQTARWSALGHPTLVANFQWLRAVQYLGEPKGDERGWDALLPLGNLITDLDPRHDYAYQVIANVLAAKGRVRDSNRLLQKGVRNCPDKYILPFHRAVNAFLYSGNYAEAGRWFEIASRVPGAPAERMRGYASSMYTKGNRVDAALKMLSDMYEEATDDESRKAIRQRMDVVRFEDAAATIERAVDRYRQDRGMYPLSLEFLIFQGYLARIPDEPLGGRWYLDAEDGRVRSTVRKDRWNKPKPGLLSPGAHPGAGAPETP